MELNTFLDILMICGAAVGLVIAIAIILVLISVIILMAFAMKDVLKDRDIINEDEMEGE